MSQSGTFQFDIFRLLILANILSLWSKYCIIEPTVQRTIFLWEISKQQYKHHQFVFPLVARGRFKVLVYANVMVIQFTGKEEKKELGRKESCMTPPNTFLKSGIPIVKIIPESMLRRKWRTQCKWKDEQQLLYLLEIKWKLITLIV